MADASGLRQAIVAAAEARARAATAAVLDEVREAAPRDSGLLASSVGEVGISSTVGLYATTISAPLDYASYQDKGTGIYGPTGQPIRPVNASVLAWPATAQMGGFSYPGAGKVRTGWVFAAEVAGVPPTGFWSDHVTPEKWAEALAAAT